MRKVIPVLLVLLAPVALALQAGEWVEVAGGTWKPGAAVLATAQRGIHDRLVAYLHGGNQYFYWGRYSFQYQGMTTPGGQRLIHVNAFCTDQVETFHAKFDYVSRWLVAFGGGPCFFKADFDPAKNAVVAFTVNGPK